VAALIRAIAWPDAAFGDRRCWPTWRAGGTRKLSARGGHPMTSDPQQSPGYVMLPVATRDFILQALRSTTQQLSKTHRLRATSAILVEEGVKLTKSNSFQIDHRDHLLIMQLAQEMLRDR